MKKDLKVMNIERMDISIEQLVDFYFAEIYNSTIYWMDHTLQGDNLILTDVDLDGPEENINDILETYAIDDDI